MSEIEDSKPLSVGEWFLTQLVIALPLIGIIMLFVWAFGSGNIGRRNYCRATLLWILVVMGLAALAGLAFLLIAVVAAGASNM